MLRWRELLNLFRLADLTKKTVYRLICVMVIVKNISCFNMYVKHVFPEDL